MLEHHSPLLPACGAFFGCRYGISSTSACLAVPSWNTPGSGDVLDLIVRMSGIAAFCEPNVHKQAYSAQRGGDGVRVRISASFLDPPDRLRRTRAAVANRYGIRVDCVGVKGCARRTALRKSHRSQRSHRRIRSTGGQRSQLMPISLPNSTYASSSGYSMAKFGDEGSPFPVFWIASTPRTRSSSAPAGTERTML